MPNKILLLDVGNTCIKYSLVDLLGGKTFGNLPQPADLLAITQQVKTCFISAVGQRQRVAEIQQLLHNQQIEVTHIHTQAEFNGLKIAYAKPDRLGVDRWLAMLACRKNYKGTFAVLDFGTAMTCDVVRASGQHHGGWIAPGYHTMQVALLKETQNLSIDNQLMTDLTLGTDTEMCINKGILAAIQGFVLSAEKYMKNEFEDYQIFIGGGDRHLLEQCIQSNIQLLDNLVLEGMSAYIQG